jgi:hypothetical protein
MRMRWGSMRSCSSTCLLSYSPPARTGASACPGNGATPRGRSRARGRRAAHVRGSACEQGRARASSRPGKMERVNARGDIIRTRQKQASHSAQPQAMATAWLTRVEAPHSVGRVPDRERRGPVALRHERTDTHKRLSVSPWRLSLPDTAGMTRSRTFYKLVPTRTPTVPSRAEQELRASTTPRQPTPLACDRS